MSGAKNKQAIKSDDAETPEKVEMAKYGITRVPADYYCFQEYRYTNLADAIAQAKRSARETR